MSLLVPALPLLLLLAPDAGTPTPAAPAETPLTRLPFSPVLDVRSLDQGVDPCTDFYEFACGGWKKANPIPADQTSWSVYGKLAEENQRVLWGLMDAAAKAEPKTRTAAQAKVGDAWAACMNEPEVEKRGTTPLEAELADVDALAKTADLPPLVARLALTGVDAFFQFGVDQDFQDSSRYVFIVDAGGLGLPDRDQYFPKDAAGKKVLAAYRSHVQTMFGLLGEPEAKAKADAATVLDIETALARASLTRTEQRDPYQVHHKLDRKRLQALTPAFSWDAFFPAITDKPIDAVDVTQPQFFKALQQVLTKEPLPALKTYLAWHLVAARADALPQRFVQAQFDFYGKVLGGAKELAPRWKRCEEWIDSALPHSLGRLYVEQAVAPGTTAAAQEMIKHVETAMEQRLNALDWMTEATRKKALEKLQAMRNKVGQPAQWRDYAKLELKRDDLYGDRSRATRFESLRRIDRLGGPIDRDEWDMSAPTVNAYYSPQMNDMNFPAGVLQPPLFDVKADAAPNYGDTGSTIGHELTHGFDDEGRQYDADGNLKSWWTPRDAAAFVSRAKCVQDQYAKYTVVDDLKLNSKLTLGEDVADLGGTVLAYQAWKEATKDQKLEPQDGFTPDQRFFIGFAQWACGAVRPEQLRLYALTNPHSPAYARVNGVVVNMPEFAKAFACKANAPMVKAKPCKVW